MLEAVARWSYRHRWPIFIDTAVVRMVLVPATMELRGRANWWLSRRLERFLPGAAVAEAEVSLGSDVDVREQRAPELVGGAGPRPGSADGPST